MESAALRRHDVTNVGNRDLTAESFVLKRIWGYLEERFPPVVYTILVALFVGSAALASRALAGIHGQVRWEAALVVLLVFFHLRVFDEHKAVSYTHLTLPTKRIV